MSGHLGFHHVPGRVTAIGCAVLLFTTTFIGLTALPAFAAGGSISGKVTPAVAGVCVSAHLTDVDATKVASTATLADGSYTLTGVPAGNVFVQFDQTSFCPGGVVGNLVGQWWNNQPSLDTATTVTVADSATTPNINATLVPGGAIAGKVTAAAGGAALNTICVAAFIPGADLRLVASTSTAVDGTYTLTGVPATNVFVQFFATGFCPGGVAATFAGQWYNGKLTPDAADAVSVTAGQTNSNINAALSVSGSFSGKVTAAAGGAPLAGICVSAYVPFVQGAVAQLITSTATAADGTYTLPGAPIGQIDVKFFDSGFCPGGAAGTFATQWYNNQLIQDTSNPVTITSGGNTPNINAALISGGSISGAVTSAATHLGLVGICVAAFSTGANPVVVASTGVLATDGTYRLDGVPPGTIQVRFNSQGFCPGGIFQHFATQWFNNKSSQAAADNVTVTAGVITPNINAAMGPPTPTSFTISVNGVSSASIAHGAQATLSETGLPPTYGTVVFSSATQPNLCTITFPGVATSCQTSAALAGGSYSPITAAFTDTDGAFTSSTSTNSASLTVTGGGTPTSFTIAANAGASATIGLGAQATLSETGIPVLATGSVVFGSPNHANLCTVTLPATSCLTSAALPVGSYTPIQALFTDTDGNFAGSIATNTVSLTIAPTTVFTILADGLAASSIAHGARSTLSETGIPASATGTVVFSAPGQTNLCTITLPATTCQTSVALAAGSYTPISALFTDTDGKFKGGTSTNTVSLTVNPIATSFTITVNGGSAASIAHGRSATMTESGLPADATGTVTFGPLLHPILCTIVLPATSCRTSTAMPIGKYPTVSAIYTPANTNFKGSIPTNKVVITVVSVPGAPSNVRAATGSGGKVTVTWDAPRSNGGAPITGYVVVFGGRVLWFGGRALWVPAATRRATFTLGNGSYHFKVRAINKVGGGGWSTPTGMVTVGAPKKK